MNRSFHKSQTLRFYDCSAVEVKSKVSSRGPPRLCALVPPANEWGTRGGELERCERRAASTTLELGCCMPLRRGPWDVLSDPGGPPCSLCEHKARRPRAMGQSMQALNPLHESCSFVPRTRDDPGAPHVGGEGCVSGAI